MTLEQIRAALQTHIMLTPGIDVWREGDEYFLTEKVKLVSNGWQEINSHNLGRKLPTKENTQHGDWFIIKTAIGIDMRVVSGYVARRPIPPAHSRQSGETNACAPRIRGIHRKGEWQTV